MNRLNLLNDIINYNENYYQALSALSKLEYDGETELVIVTPNALCNVLTRYLNKQIDADNVEFWANIIECRDDINYESIEGYIYALANPELMGAIDTPKIEAMLSLLITS